jgi:hypothetical protein
VIISDVEARFLGGAPPPPCVAISSGLPAGQSSGSFNGLTCSINQLTPQAISEPSGSMTMPSTARLPSTQLLS